MNNNILSIDQAHCTGCGVCKLVCPKNAITMYMDSNGFYKSKVDRKTCIDCGTCKKVCPKFIEEDKGYDIKKSKVYDSYSYNDKIRFKSSSGGLATEIAKYGIENDYNICGVKYNYELNRAEHVVINNEKDLCQIQGSKYIQSYTFNGLSKLDEKCKYIIIGSPCQIYGLRQYMKLKNIKNWILVDFFCHGVPSYNAWGKYINYIKKKYNTSNINSINFRDKTRGWHKFSMKILSKSKLYCKTLNRDLFLKIFLSNLCLSDPCFKCSLRFNRLYSDIRLGDFWGKKFSQDDKGISIVLTNNDKGDFVIKKLEQNINLEKCNYKDLYESQYVKELSKPEKYYNFNKDLKRSISLSKIYFKYIFFKDFKNMIISIRNLPKRIVVKILPKNIKVNIKALIRKN